MRAHKCIFFKLNFLQFSEKIYAENGSSHGGQLSAAKSKSVADTGGHKVVRGGHQRSPPYSDSVRHVMSDTDNFVSASFRTPPESAAEII